MKNIPVQKSLNTIIGQFLEQRCWAKELAGTKAVLQTESGEGEEHKLTYLHSKTSWESEHQIHKCYLAYIEKTFGDSLE